MQAPQRLQPGPGQESVWDYPRPPRWESVCQRIRVLWADHVVADSLRAIRVLETSHPPVYYLPPGDIDLAYLRPSKLRTFCEWKGMASYYSLVDGEATVENAAWCYLEPTRPFASLAGYLAFYPSRVDACYVNDERVTAQPGDFYGGWITSSVIGPFKGPPGTRAW